MTGCPHGLTRRDVKTVMGARLDEFDKWMNGQTMMICDGRKFNHDTREYEPDCPEPHGVVAYRWDVERFLAGRSVID